MMPYPFVFVADEAFALSNTLLRPFPIKGLTPERRIFNYRLSRARRCVECAFGILANKWRILHRPLDVNMELAECIIKTCCLLHNYVRKNDGYNFEDTLSYDLESITPRGVRGTINGVNVRNMFLYHFNSTEGSVPWQNKYMQKEYILKLALQGCIQCVRKVLVQLNIFFMFNSLRVQQTK